MTQERFEIPLETLRDWEQGASLPDSAARSYLRVIVHTPQVLIEAFEHERTR